MKALYTTGIGEPQPLGKKSLFQPPSNVEEKSMRGSVEDLPKSGGEPGYKVRTTIIMPKQTLVTILGMQNRHRLETGRVLPLWKLISQAVEQYSQHLKQKEQELTKSLPTPDDPLPCGPEIQVPGASLAQT